MPETLIERALRTATDTKAIEAGRGVVSRTGDVFARLFPGRTAIIVADENHWRVAGEQVVASLTAAGVPQAEPYIFPGTPTLYAGYNNIETLRDAIADIDAVVVAVSSGTLNDIAKRAVSELDRPYMCVGTAASMDGYASFGASITKDGFKQTLSCPAPAAVVADLDIMAGAPQRLTATGFGDLIEKVPAGGDWIIADELGIERIDPPHDRPGGRIRPVRIEQRPSGRRRRLGMEPGSGEQPALRRPAILLPQPGTRGLGGRSLCASQRALSAAPPPRAWERSSATEGAARAR